MNIVIIINNEEKIIGFISNEYKKKFNVEENRNHFDDMLMLLQLKTETPGDSKALLIVLQY